MRPKMLEIEGLQSFRDVQRINFEALSETGLFGIFGPTGSGKSTVLDAITFALYGKVKRADGGTQGIINTNMNSAKVSFTFELMKDGARKTFRVERVYQRKKGAPNSCEPKIARLIEITDAGEIPVCDKATDVGNQIKELLGLSHEDFTRAVVLPQNSFQEFLLLNNADRRKMLERIFYLEEYGKHLQEKLNRKMAALKSRTDILSGELKGYEDASGEALEEARRVLEAVMSERDRAEKEFKLLEAKYNEAREVWTLVRELSVIGQREETHLASAALFEEKRARLDKAVKAGGLLELIRKNKELKEKFRETERKLEEVVAEMPGVAASLEETRREQETLKSEAVREQPRLVALRTRLADGLGIRSEIKAIQEKINTLRDYLDKLKREIAGKSGTITNETAELENLEQNLGRFRLETESLKTEPDYRQQIQEGAKLENEIKTLEGNTKELEGKVASLNGVVGGLEKKLEEIRKNIMATQKALDDFNGKRLEHEAARPEDKNAVLKHIERIHSLQAVYDVLNLRRSEIQGMESKIAAQRSAHAEMAKNALLLGENRERAGAILEGCRQELEDAIREMDRNAARLLSRNLKAGEPCPVCGSVEHPKPAAHGEGPDLAVLEKRVEELREKLADAEKTFKETETAAISAEERAKAMASRIEQAAEELKTRIAGYNEQKAKLPEELRTLELEQIRLKLEEMNSGCGEKLKAFEDWEKRQEEYKEEIQKIAGIMSEHRLSESGVLSELKVNREALEQSSKALSDAKRLLCGKQDEYSEFLRRHKIEGAALELARLAENDRKINALQKRMELLQESIAGKRNFIGKLKEELQALNAGSIKTEAEISNLNAQRDEKESKLRELAGSASIEEEIKRIDVRLARYISLETQYQERLRALEKRYNDLSAQKSLLMNQREIFSENLKNEEAGLQAALFEKGFGDEREVEQSALPAEKQKALSDEIGEYDRVGTNIRAQKEMTLKKLNFRTITENEWDRISNAYAGMASYKEECISRSEVARNNFENIKNKHGKWLELDKSYKELMYKLGLLEQIQKLLRANGFIDFIAEERLRYVAAKASETLGEMTRHRYALELDADAGFIIRDNANGGVLRMVNSLSGGETFLTSLSLALALSDHIQLKGQSPLEFFFLDEGFGTLDSALLDTVIDSLERISRRERIIGLISHVPELRSRITRRLIVEPPTSQGDGSRVRLEKA